MPAGTANGSNVCEQTCSIITSNAAVPQSVMIVDDMMTIGAFLDRVRHNNSVILPIVDYRVITD